MKKTNFKQSELGTSIVQESKPMNNETFSISGELDTRIDQITALYGPPKPSTANIIWKITEIFIIPIILLIGLIMYFKKSKSSKKVKILVTIIVIAVTVLLYFVVNEFIFKYE